MHIYIKEWSDKTATIMIEDDTSLWTFKTLEEASNFCRICYDINNVDCIAYQAAENNYH